MLNTAGGIPVVSAKGKQDLQNFMALNKRNVDAVPNRESVLARMQWLMHPSNHHLLAEELIDLRLKIYLAPETPTRRAEDQRRDPAPRRLPDPARVAALRDAVPLDRGQPDPRPRSRTRRGGAPACERLLRDARKRGPLAAVRGPRRVQRSVTAAFFGTGRIS
jgi:hypothetical protein